MCHENVGELLLLVQPFLPPSCLLLLLVLLLLLLLCCTLLLVDLRLGALRLLEFRLRGPAQRSVYVW